MEEIDAFGRIRKGGNVPVNTSLSAPREKPQNKNRSSSRDRGGRSSPPRRESRFVRRDRSPPRRDWDRRDNRDYRDQPVSRHVEYYEDYRGRYEDAYDQGYYYEPNPEPAYDPSLSMPPPLLPYAAFAHTLPRDVSPIELQKAYDEYWAKYMKDFSDHFFNLSCAEEWFQDRYNPINLVNQEKELSTWASEEATRIRTELLLDTGKFFAAACLSPRDTKTASNAPVAENSDAADKEISGKHFQGHTTRTIFVAGVHACCPKTVFKQAIIQALTNESDSTNTIPVDRILVGQPAWTKNNLFERCAWVVLQDASHLRRALTALKDLTVHVPAAPSMAGDGEDGVLFSFTPHVLQHQVKDNLAVPHLFSKASRIQIDLRKSLKLAHLLDQVRGVGAQGDGGIAGLLREVGGTADVLGDAAMDESDDKAARRGAILTAVDLLDLTLAYLRRVHCVQYYGGGGFKGTAGGWRSYRSEAHLLASTPSVVYRSAPVEKEEGKEEEGFSVLKLLEEVLRGDKSETEGEKHDEEVHNEDDDQADQNEEEEGGNDEGDGDGDHAESGRKRRHSNAEEPVSATTPATPASNAPRILFQDSLIDAMIREAESRLLAKNPVSSEDKDEMADDKAVNEGNDNKAKVGVIGGFIQEEEDAAKLTASLDATLLRLVQEHIEPEEDGKVRCCYGRCKKLFKSCEFLSKHLKSKHPEFGWDGAVASGRATGMGAGVGELLECARPYMLARFEAEGLVARPLPPVGVEGPQGSVYMSIGEAMKVYGPNSHKKGHGYDNNKTDRRRGGPGGRDRDRDRDRRDSHTFTASSRPPAPHLSVPKDRDNRDSHTGNNQNANNPFAHKKIVSYVDVDAPKESVVSVDYGVALPLPPMKRRRVKAQPPAAQDASANASSMAADEVQA